MSMSLRDSRIRAIVVSFIAAAATCGALTPFSTSYAQEFKDPGKGQGIGNSSKGSGLGESVAQRLKDSKKNEFRGGVQSEEEVEKNMDTLFKFVTADAPDLQRFLTDYSIHIRDINFDEEARDAIQQMRRDAPPKVFLPPAVAYPPMNSDSNFRVCCVRDGEQGLATLPIVLAHPEGDGWAALSEVNYPDRVTEMSNARTESMILTQQFIKNETDKVRRKIEGNEGKTWVSKAIKDSVKAVGKATGGGAGGGGDTSNVDELVQDDIKAIQDGVKKELQFTDDISQDASLTVRVNLATMLMEKKKAIGRKLCVGGTDKTSGVAVVQFGKIMAPNVDPTFKNTAGGGSHDEAIRNVKPFSSFSEEGFLVMSDEKRSDVHNPFETPTDFAKGMQFFRQFPLGCVAHRWKDKVKGYTVDPLVKNAQKLDEEWQTDQASGFTCPLHAASTQQLVPVKLFKEAPVDRREFSAALGFTMIAAWFNAQNNGKAERSKSDYKNFDPKPHFSYKGVPPDVDEGDTNEFGTRCENSTQGENYGPDSDDYKEQGDAFALSTETKDYVDEKIKDSWFRYMRTWEDKGDVPVKGKNINAQKYIDKDVHNYGTTLSIKAVCPMNEDGVPWVRWNPPANDVDLPPGAAERIRGYCGSEKLS